MLGQIRYIYEVKKDAVPQVVDRGRRETWKRKGASNKFSGLIKALNDQA